MTSLMQSSLLFYPSPPTVLQSPQKFLPPNTLILNKVPPFRTISVSPSNSLNTSFDSDFREFFENQDPPISKISLPIVIRKNGRVSRYLWNGNSLELVSIDGRGGSGSIVCLDFIDGLREVFKVFWTCVRDFFVPKQVHEHYIDYVKWKFLHRVFSSALQVLATQAMFRAIGVGYAQSFPSAAALNWVLKDGLGRFSRCIYTASIGSAFDTNLKRVRFATSILFSLSLGVELLTPLFPNCFLLLATVANIAKQISLACHIATGSAVHRSFAIADNLGEISAKDQIQTVCFDNLGLLLVALLNILCKNNQRLQAGLPFIVYPIFSAFDLCGIYQALKHVHLQTLTKDRLEIILNTWIQFGYVPSPAEVSEKESIALFNSSGEEFWPIRIGCLSTNSQIPLLTMLTLKSLSSEDFFFISMEACRGLRGGRQVMSLLPYLLFGHNFMQLRANVLYVSNTVQHICLCLREGAGAFDIIRGLFQACYLRKALLLSWSPSENVAKACIFSEQCVTEWFRVLQDSKFYAAGGMNKLQEQIFKMGWAANSILLNTQEQARYSFVDGKYA